MEIVNFLAYLVSVFDSEGVFTFFVSCKYNKLY